MRYTPSSLLWLGFEAPDEVRSSLSRFLICSALKNSSLNFLFSSLRLKQPRSWRVFSVEGTSLLCSVKETSEAAWCHFYLCCCDRYRRIWG